MGIMYWYHGKIQWFRNWIISGGLQKQFICQFYMIIYVVWFVHGQLQGWFWGGLQKNSYVNFTQSFQLYGCPWTTPRIIPIRIKSYRHVQFHVHGFCEHIRRVEENVQREHLVVSHTNIRKLMFLKQNQSLTKQDAMVYTNISFWFRGAKNL